jgi:hypothetical protein
MKTYFCKNVLLPSYKFFQKIILSRRDFEVRMNYLFIFCHFKTMLLLFSEKFPVVVKGVQEFLLVPTL